MKKRNLQRVATSLGGVDRRMAKINLKKRIAYYKIGDGAETIFWKFSEANKEKERTSWHKKKPRNNS